MAATHRLADRREVTHLSQTRVSALHQATAPPLTTGGGLCSRGRATGCSASKTAPPGAQDLRSRRPRQPQAQPHGTQLPHPQQSLAHCAARAVDTTRPDGLRYPPSKITLCIEIPVSVPILRPTSYPKRYPVLATTPCTCTVHVLYESMR